MPMMDKKDGDKKKSKGIDVAVLVGGPEEDEDMKHEAERMSAKGIIKAVKMGDSGDLADALKSFLRACGAIKDDEDNSEAYE